MPLPKPTGTIEERYAKALASAKFLDRFWDKVKRGGPDECWEWVGGKTGGYGRIKIVSGLSQQGAHRIAWELANGVRFPAGKVACHSCDNPCCVNAAHIWVGTQRDNIADMAAKGRSTVKGHLNALATHCKRGHDLNEPANVFENARGRKCKLCRAITGRDYYYSIKKPKLNRARMGRII